VPDDRYSDDAPPGDRYDDQPPRRRDDDDARYRDDPDIRRPRSSELSWIDRQYRDTNIVLLVIFCLCCNVLALPFGIIGLVTCQDPDSRQKAMIVTILSGVLVGVGILLRVMSAASAVR
jgi:hypothetical protein